MGTWSTSLVADTPVDGSFHDPGYRSFFLAAGEYIALDRSFPARKSLPGTKLHSSNSSPPQHVQVLIVQKVIYMLDQDGVVSALWTRHKYVYLLWQHSVAPSSKLLRVDHDVVYLASPDGSIVGLRASDGAFLWSKRGS